MARAVARFPSPSWKTRGETSEGFRELGAENPYYVRTQMAHDVLVIGGGPAGSTAAALLAKAGHDVLLIEAAAHPRPHVGESLLPGIVPILEEMGALSAVAAAGFEKKTGTTHFKWGRTPAWDLWFSDTDQFDHAWLVARARFDEILFRAAERAGATVREHTRASAPIYDGQRVVGARIRERGADTEQEVRARFVVDASGQNALLSKGRALREHIDGLRHQASWAHYAGAGRLPPPRANQALFVAETGYWLWLFPLSDDHASVGMVRLDGSDNPQARDAAFEAGVAQSETFMQVLGKGARRITPIRHERDFTYRMREVAGPGHIAIGDASGFIDPVLSTGVFLAMHAARHAATLISDVLHGKETEPAALERYTSHHRQLFGDLLRMVRFYYQQNLGRDDYFWESKRILLREDTQLKPQKAFLILTSGLVQNLALTDASERSLARRSRSLAAGKELAASTDDLGFVCVHLRYDDGSDRPAQLYLLVEPTDPSAPSLFRTAHFDVNCLAPRYDNDPISHPALEPHLRRVHERLRELDTDATPTVGALWAACQTRFVQIFADLPEQFQLVRVFGE
jgi:flavin-dependent dehydrogenase